MKTIKAFIQSRHLTTYVHSCAIFCQRSIQKYSINNNSIKFICFWDSIIVLKFPCRKNYLLIKSKRKMDDLFFSALFFLNPISKLILLSNKELQCLRPINLILVFKIEQCDICRLYIKAFFAYLSPVFIYN